MISYTHSLISAYQLPVIRPRSGLVPCLFITNPAADLQHPAPDPPCLHLIRHALHLGQHSANYRGTSCATFWFHYCALHNLNCLLLSMPGKMLLSYSGMVIVQTKICDARVLMFRLSLVTLGTCCGTGTEDKRQS